MIDIRNCDNMELMAKYPDKFFDLAIVDPPYGIDINMNMGRKNYLGFLKIKLYGEGITFLCH